jgi:hypothetical protein
MGKDGKSDMKKPIVAFRNFANALKNDDDLEIAVVRWMSAQDTD